MTAHDSANPYAPGTLSAPAGARRILCAVGVVCMIALWPREGWVWQTLPLLLLVSLSLVTHLDWATLGRRLGVVWVLSGLMALGLLGQPDWRLRAGNLLLKATLSVWTLSLLAHTTPLPDLLAGLRRLGLPRLWTESLGFWSRYYGVLAQEWQRLQLARQARLFRPRRRLEFRVLAHALGLLFIRAYERAEQVHRAMLARGYRESK